MNPLFLSVSVPLCASRLKYVLPSIIKRKRGTIINLTGTSQSVPTVFKTAYNSSKFAMDGYAESLSQQLFQSTAAATDQALAQRPSVRIGKDFAISFVTMSVGDIKSSQRISLSVTPTDDIKQKLLGDDAELKEHGHDDADHGDGVTFEQWATSTVSIIRSLDIGVSADSAEQQQRYCNVDRIIDLQSMMKMRGSDGKE